MLVDEYQDTNHVQYRLVRVLAEPERNVVAVGDDDQGIYSWRGADVRNILDFERDYPDAHVVALEQNYRSTGTILRAANAVVERNPHRHPKRLWTDLGEGEPITAVSCRDEHEEARVVAVRDRLGHRPRRVARRTSRSSTAPTRRAARSRISWCAARCAYVVVGGPRFYERAEIRDLLAYLRVVANPSDGVSLARMLGAPKRGIGPGAIAKLEAHAQALGVPVADALLRPDEIPGLPAGQRATLGADRRAARATSATTSTPARPLDRVLEEVLERSGLRDALLAEGTFEAQGRIENLEEMVRVAAEFEATQQEATLADFLEGIALQADADLVDSSGGAVTLMTIHNAKGLEFDTVLITGLEEGLFPHVRSDTPETLEEERRLFYVGLTRARRHLTLTHAESRAMHGGRDYRLPSRFLGEIPADALAEPPGGRRPARQTWAGAAMDAPARGAAFATGDSVLHATFGEGVVTGIDGGGDLVRVRFAQDGSERRLMAGAAPMRKVRLMAGARSSTASRRRRSCGRRSGAGVDAFRLAYGRVPGLVGVQVGDDPASELYQAGKARAAEEAGMISRRVVLPDTTTQAELDALIDDLNADDAVERDAGAAPGPRPAVRGARSPTASTPTRTWTASRRSTWGA